MQLVIIWRERKSHLHLDNFSKLSVVRFLSSKFYKIFHPKAEGQSTFGYLFHPHGLDRVLVSFCSKRVYCAFPAR